MKYEKPVVKVVVINLKETPIMFACGNCNNASQAGPNC